MSVTSAVLRADAMLTPRGVVTGAELEFDASGRIVYAGHARGRRAARAPGTEVHDLRGHVLMPGLVNAHTHAAMTLQRGVCDDEGFMPWLRAVQGLERHLSSDDIAAGLELAMLEMIASGTTSFADMYHWDEGLVERVRSAGMRVLAAPATFGPESVGFPGADSSDGAQVTAQTERLAARYADDPQVRLAYGPHAPYTCPPEFLRDIAERSRRTGIPVHTHVSESPAEVADIRARYGTTPVMHLDRAGLVNERLLAAHCVHPTAEEVALLSVRGAAVSHNPVSNLKLGTGVAPLPELMAGGIRVGLGTDGVASNNTLDMFEEIKTAAILHRGVRRDAAAVRARDALRLATRGGAEAIGFADAGALEAGRLADVIALDITGATAAVLDVADGPSVVSHLGFTARGGEVGHVFIGGRHVYADGRHLTLDADEVVSRARAAVARLRTVARADAASA